MCSDQEIPVTLELDLTVSPIQSELLQNIVHVCAV